MSPSRAVLVLGAAGGLLFVLVTPPFQAPDEPVHFLRAYQISEGDLFAPGGPAGARLPVSLAAVVERFDRLPFHPEARIAPREVIAAFGEPLAPARRAPAWLGATASYTPVPYLPQAAGALAGRLLGLPPLAILYLERLANLAAGLLLAWTAVRLAPLAAWPLALVALLPMAMFLRGSASADAVTSGAALLVAAAVLAAAYGPAAERRRAWTLFLAGSALLALSKVIYFLLPLAALIVPAGRFASRRRAAAAYGGILLLAAAGLAASAWTAPQGIGVERPGAVLAPAAQARGMVREPLRFLSIASGDYFRHAPRYLAQIVGNLGWLDTPLPAPLVAGYGLLLAYAALAGGAPLPAGRRLFLLALAAVTLLLVSAALYVAWTPLRAPAVDGIQGRHLIPVVPFVVLALGSRLLARDLSAGRAPWLLSGAVALATAIALVTLVLRFYEL